MKCGIDIVSIKRIQELVERRGSEKLSRIWTKSEIESATGKDGTLNIPSLAGKYAVKEAVSKAFGTGFGRCGVNFIEIEVKKGKFGEPQVILHGTTKEYYDSKGCEGICVSISHEGDIATAICIIQENQRNEVEI